LADGTPLAEKSRQEALQKVPKLIKLIVGCGPAQDPARTAYAQKKIYHSLIVDENMKA